MLRSWSGTPAQTSTRVTVERVVVAVPTSNWVLVKIGSTGSVTSVSTVRLRGGVSLGSTSAYVRLSSAAVTRLHADPSRAWTPATLARETGVSRATLSRRFATMTGESPGAYLTRWRMDLAARRLRDTDDSLETIAQSVGYTSVYAFSRAFSRIRSQPPGQYRSRSPHPDRQQVRPSAQLIPDIHNRSICVLRQAPPAQLSATQSRQGDCG